MRPAALDVTPRQRPRRLDRLLLRVILVAGLVGVIATVQLFMLLALGRVPTDEEGEVFAASTVAASFAALLFQPVRTRLEALVDRLPFAEHEQPTDALLVLGNRLGQALPVDELLAELADSLRSGFRLEATEIWTGSAGLLERSISDPPRAWASMSVSAAEEAVMARVGVAGPGWLAVWIPALLDGRADRPLRVAPITNADELLGLIVAERGPEGDPFDEREDGDLAEIARQVGLGLRNVRLDAQLQASLDALRRQAEELRASRARVVSAADAERRRIEHDLHDGAQQHLVALGANLRVARELAGSSPAEATSLLEQLGRDVRVALEELRELAHGIYPPLLADRGLGDALSAVARRAPVRTRLVANPRARYPPNVEAAVYFCCLEALQNTGKHAGEGAAAIVRVWEEEGALLFDVSDDGAGFELDRAWHGAGLTNMADRLGAIGGGLRIKTAPGAGARLTGTIPLRR
jgi:signal transduction histidine kinase